LSTDFRAMLRETNIGTTCTALVGRAKTYIESLEDLASRTGRDVRDMPVEPADLPVWNLAERQSRLASVAGVIAATVFAASGLLAAPLLALLPGVHEQALRALAPLRHSPNGLLAWLANQAGALPLVGTVAWALIYAGWLQGVYLLVSSAHRGQSRWLIRIAVGVLSLGFGTVGFEVLNRLGAPFVAALAPLALILAAWRLLAWSTRQHARTTHRLNWWAAHREIAQEKRAARRPAPVASTPHRWRELTERTVTSDNATRVLNELEPLLRERSLRLSADPALVEWPAEDGIDLTITDPVEVFADPVTARRWFFALRDGRKLGVHAVVPDHITLTDVHGEHLLLDLLAKAAGSVVPAQF
jgi:hypothetical protein